MGGLFSFDKNQELFPLEDPAASGLHVDADVTFNGSTAGVTATASNHPGAAGMAEAAVPTGQEDTCTLTRVTDAATRADGEALASAKLP